MNEAGVAVADFVGEVALVTGAGSGLGAAIALELAERGAMVVATDIDADSAEATSEAIIRAGGSAIALPLDTTDLSAHEHAVSVAVENFGKLTLAVNNAGIATPAAPIGEMDMAAWDRLLSINLTGVAYGLRHQIPAMLVSGTGAIVNMASILGSVGATGIPASYIAAKHGVVGLTKSAALDYAKRGIRVNSVGPAFIKTPLLSNVPVDALPTLADLHPLGRLGEPEEVSALVCFLLSRRASFITGSHHLVDGGFTAQ
jgi:NAD(P)-dependent dehydrogenase (short-subunit alcohol dehydrogenase family)